ncbi:MAG TPA: pitrilysin family protein [Polyangiales bacterium]
MARSQLAALGLRSAARLVLLAGALAALWSAQAQAQAQAPAVNVRRFSLPNGLRVILAPDPRAQLACVLVRYDLGSRDDPRGYSGLAHLTEHMTFRTASSLERLEQIGATTFNGITGFDASYYYAVVPPSALAASLWLESHRMAFAAADMPAEEFDMERRVVLREWSEHCDSVLGELRSKLMRRLYPEDPAYARLCDQPKDLRAMDLDDVRWFTQTHYRPERAIVVVSGNVDMSRAETLVREHFGGLRPTGPARARAGLTRERAFEPVRVREAPGVEHEILVLVWPLPGSEDPRSEVYVLALELLEQRIDEQLVHPPHGSTSYASIGLEARERESVATLTLVARTSEKADQLRSEVDAIIAEFQRDVPPAPLFGRVRLKLSRSYERALSDASGRAFALAGGQEEMAQRLLSVTPAEVRAAFRRWFRPEARVEGVLASEQP